MNVRRASAFAIVVIGLLLVHPALAGPWSLKPGEYVSDVSGSRITTSTYADENGDTHDFAGGGSLQRRAWLASSEFGWKKTTSFILDVPFVSETRAPFGQATLPTTTVMGDAVVGLKRSLASGRSAAAFEVDGVLPLGYQRHLALTHADSVLATRADGSFDWNVGRALSVPRAGDGQAAVAGTLHLGTALGNAGFVSGYGGYAYRGSQWQGQIWSGADVAWWFGHSWLIGARYRGVTAGKGDEVTRDASWMTIAPVVTFRVDDDLDLNASVSHVLSAKNTTLGNEVRAGFTFKHTKLNRVQGYLGSAQRP